MYIILNRDMYAHRRAKLKTKTKHIIILSFILIIYYVTSKKDYCELLYIIHSMLFIFSAKFSSTSCFLIFIFHFLSAFLHIIRSFHISLNENRFFFIKLLFYYLGNTIISMNSQSMYMLCL